MKRVSYVISLRSLIIELKSEHNKDINLIHLKMLICQFYQNKNAYIHSSCYNDNVPYLYYSHKNKVLKGTSFKFPTKTVKYIINIKQFITRYNES